MGRKVPVATFPAPAVKYWLMNSGLVMAQMVPYEIWSLIFSCQLPRVMGS